MDAVADHHGIFRFRYRRRDDDWVQVSDPTGEVIGIAERVTHGPAELAHVVADAKSGIDIAAGPLLRMTIVRSADGGVSLVLVAHHLVTDFLSWGIVLDDLIRAYRHRERGEPVRLPVVPTPYDEWARRLHGYANSLELRSQLPYWTARAESLPEQGPSCERQARSVRRFLCRDETAALLDALAVTGGKRPYEAVLASVVHAVARETRLPAVWVDLEGHGRENLFDDVDLTRTVGWFTALYPVAFPVDPVLPPARILAEVETTLDQIPDHGLGYGLLRYACSDVAVRERLAAVPRPGVSFNYLGRLGWLLGDRGRDDPRLFRPVPAPDGHD
ncbi:MAG: condensation domain-containing protein, partial [Candidatus Dormibacteria bacterium]